MCIPWSNRRCALSAHSAFWQNDVSPGVDEALYSDENLMYLL
ncbi:MAG: hypothetical protein OJF49_001929 [Ktedonobacterales bacterium]|nr:MAG: hypothetical protein OJF49_001929 [Ktedonobacterales bacterium]